MAQDPNQSHLDPASIDKYLASALYESELATLEKNNPKILERQQK